MSWIVRLILRRAGWIAAVGTLLAAVGGYYSVKLFSDLRTDIEELLPTTARSVLNFEEVKERLLSTDNIAVVVRSQDPENSLRFINDLARELEKLPKNLIASVEYKIDRELEFFNRRKALYIETSDLERIRNFIRDRIEYETALYNPYNIIREEELPEPKLDFQALKKKYESKTSSYSHYPNGYYATTNGQTRVLLAHQPSGGGMGMSTALKMRRAIDEVIGRLNPKSYASDLEILYSNGVQNLIEEHEALVEDLVWSTILTVVLVAIAMFVYYRSFWATNALLASLFLATLWTFGLSYYWVGYLNANSAFMASIVVGNGINFGIIFLARYIEERRKGQHSTRSVYLAITTTAGATIVAALGAGLAYGSLILTSFRGFKQFGVIGFIGMILCWLGAYTLLPAFLVLLDRWKILGKHFSMPKAYLSGAIATAVKKAPKAIWGISLAHTVFCLLLMTGLGKGILETDLKKLRNIKSFLPGGSAYNSRYVDEVFQKAMSPLVAMPHSREEAEAIGKKLKEIQKQEGAASHIVSVLTLSDFLPTDQPRKIQLLQEIRSLLAPNILRRLGPEEKQLIAEFLRPESFSLIEAKDLPELIKVKFTEKSGAIGNLTVIEPPMGRELDDGDALIAFVKRLRDAADSVRPGTPVAGQLPVSSDLIGAIMVDGPRAALFAFIAVVLLILVLFRELRTILIASFALIIGMLWMMGFVVGVGFKVNFMNFIALPITFGIGVDYGVNIFQRYRIEGPGNILKALRATGGAVMLASLTTLIGYGSLLIASNQAFVSFGKLAVLGELTCLAAALFSLPAYLHLADQRTLHQKHETKASNRSSSSIQLKPLLIWVLFPVTLGALVLELLKAQGVFLSAPTSPLASPIAIDALKSFEASIRLQILDRAWSADMLLSVQRLFWSVYLALLGWMVSRRLNTHSRAVGVPAWSGLAWIFFWLVSPHTPLGALGLSLHIGLATSLAFVAFWWERGRAVVFAWASLLVFALVVHQHLGFSAALGTISLSLLLTWIISRTPLLR